MKLFESSAMRALEEEAVQAGTVYSILVEGAGEATARLPWDKVSGAHAVILCGEGNDGGDGFVAARHPADWGAQVCVVLIQSESEIELASLVFRQMDLQKVQVLDRVKESEAVKTQVYGADFVLNVMYDIGFRGSLLETLFPLLDAAETSGAYLLALDLPNGVSCDAGEIPGRCACAAETVSFTTLKPAYLIQPDRSYYGKVTVVPVGISEQLAEEAQTPLFDIEERDLTLSFQQRKENTSGGNHDTLFSVCGSTEMMGTAILAAHAVPRNEAGLVNMTLPSGLYPVVTGALPEPVYTLLGRTHGNVISEDGTALLNQKMLNASTVLFSCGLGTSVLARSLLRRAAACSSVPFVINVDRIDLLAENIDILKTVRVPVVLTLHPGEMARLLYATAEQVQRRRLDYARHFTQKHGMTLVLKDSGTIVTAPDGRVFVDTTGDPGMAKGSSGDVLAGMIASSAAQGIMPYQATVFDMLLHGFAGDRCAKKLSQRGILSSDLIGEPPLLLSEPEQ